MNDRIKELAAQNERIWNLYTIGPVQRAEVEDFAEAIIRECLAQVDKVHAMLEDNAEQTGVAWVGLAISKHFGVKG